MDVDLSDNFVESFDHRSLNIILPMTSELFFFIFWLINITSHKSTLFYDKSTSFSGLKFNLTCYIIPILVSVIVVWFCVLRRIGHLTADFILHTKKPGLVWPYWPALASKLASHQFWPKRLAPPKNWAWPQKFGMTSNLVSWKMFQSQFVFVLTGIFLLKFWMFLLNDFIGFSF